MKKLISLLMTMCMVISCAAAAAYAEEKEEDYSSLFFEHMKDYLAENMFPEGLVRSKYKYLGDTSNGYHVAYCVGNRGENCEGCERDPGYGSDSDLSNFKDIKGIVIGDYLIRGDWYLNGLSHFGIYCFNDEHCTSVDEVFTIQAASNEGDSSWYREIPLDELMKLVNTSEKVHIYYRDDMHEDNELSVYFMDKKILPYFRKYAGYPEDSKENEYDCNCSVIGKYDKYCIFRGYGPWCLPMFISKAIDGYVVIAPSIYSPYDLGIYAFDGGNIFTLEEAIDKKLFKMSDIADMIQAEPITPGDLNSDGEVNMQDVVFLQRMLVGLFIADTANKSEYVKCCADIDQDGVYDMYDVVLIQRKIAKLDVKSTDTKESADIAHSVPAWLTIDNYLYEEEFGEYKAPEHEEKEYCNATLDDEFEDDAVGVVLMHDVSIKAKIYTKDDFNISGIKEVEDLTQFYVDTIRRGYFEEGNTFDIRKFHQILRLTLDEKSKENVLRVVKELEKLDFILAAAPRYINRISLMTCDNTKVSPRTTAADTKTDSDSYTQDYDPDSEICPPPKDEPNTDEKGRKHLKDFCEWIIKKYNEHKNDETDNELFVGYNSEAKDIAKYYLDHPETLEKMNLTQAMDEFNRLRGILTNIKPEAYDELVSLASKETNENDYCKEKLWKEFAVALYEAKMHREDCSYEKYYDLRRCFGGIMQYNAEIITYDVNRDYELNLLDVSAVQKYLAGLTDLSCSQILVASTNKYGDVSMETVTEMQKIIAGLKNWYDIERGTELYHTEYYDRFINLLIKRYTNNVQIDLMPWYY